jgi:hypothetical protein
MSHCPEWESSRDRSDYLGETRILGSVGWQGAENEGAEYGFLQFLHDWMFGYPNESSRVVVAASVRAQITQVCTGRNNNTRI